MRIILQMPQFKVGKNGRLLGTVLTKPVPCLRQYSVHEALKYYTVLNQNIGYNINISIR